MAEENNNDTEATQTDIFKQQEKTIDLLYDVLQRKQSQTQQPVFVSPPVPTKKAPPNYAIWAGIAISAYALFLRR